MPKRRVSDAFPSLFDAVDDVLEIVAPEPIAVAESVAVAPDPPPQAVDVAGETVYADRRGQTLLAMYTEDDVVAMRIDETFPRVDEDLPVDYACPCCGYAWSGNPKPKTADLERETSA